jgi:hypothetical protein
MQSRQRCSCCSFRQLRCTQGTNVGATRIAAGGAKLDTPRALLVLLVLATIFQGSTSEPSITAPLEERKATASSVNHVV